MSTLWDLAVRAVQSADADLQRTDDLSHYYCGGRGSVSFCDHRACRVVAALAGQDLLDYAYGQLDRSVAAGAIAVLRELVSRDLFGIDTDPALMTQAIAVVEAADGPTPTDVDSAAFDSWVSKLAGDVNARD